MNTGGKRILMRVMTIPENDSAEQKFVDSISYQINNILNGTEQTPNTTAICDYCKNNKTRLGQVIRRGLDSTDSTLAFYDPSKKGPSNLFRVIEDSEKARLRVVLYPGRRDDFTDFKIEEATHNMIIQFASSQTSFVPTEAHDNIPSFYQVCSSENMALLYIEALLVDACMCHYMMISDAAFHHYDKQRISQEKVQFILNLCKSDKMLSELSGPGRNLVKQVAENLQNNTPYISFLSIFTIAPYDTNSTKNIGESDRICEYFDDYCKLWGLFQKWFYTKHGRVFFKGKEIGDPIEALFDGNKYYGQISRDEAKDRIQKTIEDHAAQELIRPYGCSNGYSFVIISNMPRKPEHRLLLESLFTGQLHQAKWDIFRWSDLEKFDPVSHLIETVPFMIDV